MIPGAIAVFVSGMTVMVAELISARLTAPYYGQSSATWAALAGVTLLGVTLGNYFGGKISNRVRYPLSVAAVGTLFGALSLGGLPSLLPVLARLSGYGDFGLCRFVISAFLLPTAFLGVVSPSIATAYVRTENSGRDLGALYFSSMIGCTVGSAIAGLYLPFVLATDAICYVCAALLSVAGVLLAIVFRSRARKFEYKEGRGTVSLQSVAPNYVAFFLIGFVGMASELALARLVTPVLGGSHIVWSSIFITFIGFMGVGGFCGGKAADRIKGEIPVWSFFVTLFVILYVTVLFETRVLGLWTMGYSSAMRIVLHVVIGFGPYALALGFLSAFFLQRSTRGALASGDRSAIGFAYAVNGVGSSCGSFFAGMLFTASASVLASLPGAVRPLPAEIESDPLNMVMFRGESSYNSVAVTVNRDDQRQVTIWLDRIPHTTCDVKNPDYLNSTYTRLVDTAVDVFRSKEEGMRVFVIGGGGYALPRKWNNHRGVYSEITVAEIDPLVSRCAHRYMDAPANDGCVYDYIVDGRRLAEDMIRNGDTNRFDFVIGDTIGDAAIPYHLTTREFFAEIRDSLLRDDGVYLMHVLDQYDDPGLLGSIVKTLRSVYSDVCAVSYSGVRDVRQSFVVAASMRKLDPLRLSDEIIRRYPEALPIVIDGKWECGAEAVLLTDSFAPVEKFVWRVMDKDVQYRSYTLARKLSKVGREDGAAAELALARQVLEMQPEQTDALASVAQAADNGCAEAVELLKVQAERPSVKEEAKVRYASFLMRNGRGEEALPIWQEVVRRWPRNPEYRKALKSLEKR